MKKFNHLFIRFGLHLGDLEDYLSGKETVYGDILRKTMDHVGDSAASESDVDTALQLSFKQTDGPGGETLVNSSIHELPLSMIDPYIRGISRWLNELGIYTLYSCDGHNQRPATVELRNYLKPQQRKVIEAAIPSSINLHIRGKKIQFRYERGKIEDLLIVAENLYALWSNSTSLDDLQAEKFKEKLIVLLNIPGESRNEREVARFLTSELRSLSDYVYTDRKGNLLGYLVCGEGPTILLSAHMDTVERIETGREILETGTILRSSKGILGADDRAGIAIILEVLAGIRQTNFNGTIKFAFTVEEEIGLCGAKDIDKEFIADVDAAIVIDRRGNSDIVTSCMGIYPFCNEEYGEIFEQAGRLAGMPDWKMTQGGYSDTLVFAENGINAVNLSAGYRNEHSEHEYVDYRASFNTYKLIETVLHYQLIR
jgi:tripeptide aminopeptidase